MKKYVGLLLLAVSVVFMFGLPQAFASADRMILYEPSNLAKREITHTQRQATSPLYVQVRLVHDNGDNTTTESVIAPKVADVTFRYYVARNSAGEYVGGYVATGEYPRVTANAPSYLNVSASKASNPTVMSVEGHLTYYTVEIRGGALTVSYNSVIYYDPQGNIVRTERNTKNVAFYYETTGP